MTSSSLVDKDGNAVELVFADLGLYSIVCQIKYIVKEPVIVVEPSEPPSPGGTSSIYNVYSNRVSRGDRLTVTISGASFQNTTTVNFGEGGNSPSGDLCRC